MTFPYQGVTPERPHLGGYVTSLEDTGTWSPPVLYALFQKVRPSTVTDIGCGAGHVAEWFLDRGCHVIGVDGCDMPSRFDRIVHDYEQGPLTMSTERDLAVSFEFVEHVERRYMGNWLETARSHRWFALSHATPGQAGHHHVNCQFPSFWISYLEGNGFKLDAPFSMDMRASISRRDDAARCLKNSFLLFERV